MQCLSMNLQCCGKKVQTITPKHAFKKKKSLHLFCYTLLCLFFSLLFFFSSRSPWFSGASSSQSRGHEEQERGEFGRHSTRYETLPVSPELLRAGDHTWRLHPRCCSGPGTFRSTHQFKHLPLHKVTFVTLNFIFICFLVLPGSSSCGPGLPLPRMCQICPPL